MYVYAVLCCAVHEFYCIIQSYTFHIQNIADEKNFICSPMKIYEFSMQLHVRFALRLWKAAEEEEKKKEGRDR